MDIHRSRFVAYPTSATTALAFSRSSDSGYNGPPPAIKLAVGRADGNVEVWHVQKGCWVQETVFLGDGRSIDGLAWTQDPDEIDSEGHVMPGQHRLFSIASSPAVTEWDLATGQPKRRSTGNFSEVWCFAAQPRMWPQKTLEDEDQTQDVVAGCGDGTLVLISTADNDLQFKRFLARVSGKRARCMCVTYQNRDRVVAGFADSIIRIYDTRNGSLLRNMSLGMGVPGAPKNVLVWQVRCLPNGDIVSGDSNGEVKSWDGKTYSLSQRIEGHENDCIDLITSSDGKTMFSGSIDGKMATYRQSVSPQGRKSWAKGSHRRIHGGEVKAMAAFDSKHMSVVASGGSDVAPMITPLREFGKENVRSLPSLPQEPPLASAPRARLLVSWWDKSIYIWRMAKLSSVDAVPEPQKPRKLVARININTKHRIRSVSISSDGKLLAASTSTEVKAFQLRRRLQYESLAVRKIEVPKDVATNGARLLCFSPDGKWLAIVTPDCEVYVARLAADPYRPKHLQLLSQVVELDRQHRKRLVHTAFKEYDRTISRLAFACDSSVLVTSDLSGYLDSWVLEGHEDLTAAAVDLAKHDSQKGSLDATSDTSSDSGSSDDDDALTLFYGQHWAENPAGHLLPKLESPPLVLTFRPTLHSRTSEVLVNGNPGVHSTRHNPHAHSHELPLGQHRLWLMTARHQMYEFDVLSGRSSDWSRRNPTAVLPEDLTKIRDRVMGAIWDVDEEHERLWLYGSSFVFMLNVGVDLGQFAEPPPPKEPPKKRRRQQRPAVEEADVRKRRKLESGAGGSIEMSRQPGVVGVVRQHKNGVQTTIDLGRQARPSYDDDDEDDDAGKGLQLMRLRGSGDEPDATVDDDVKVKGDDKTGSNVAVDGDATSPQERRWWCTFTYRPILGMVPLEDDLSDGDRALEVALVERPLWEARSEGVVQSSTA